MAELIKYAEEDYSFDASARTVTFSKVVKLPEVLLITNVTDNIIIYEFACDGLGGSVLGTVLTLEYDTTSMSDGDELLVILQKDKSDSDTLLQRIADDLRDIKELITENLKLELT